MAGSALSEKHIPRGFLPRDGKGTDKYCNVGAIGLSQLILQLPSKTVCEQMNMCIPVKRNLQK